MGKKKQRKIQATKQRSKTGAGQIKTPQKKFNNTSVSTVPAKILYVISFILFALTVILYSGTFKNNYTYDDAAVIVQNRFVQKGFDGIKDILKTQYFEGYDPNTNAMAYRPVSLVTYAIEYEFFGLNPTVSHIVNVLLYAFTAIVLFLILLNLFKQYHYLLPLMITLLFIAHPIHTEVVANIKSRDELVGFLNFSIAILLLLKNMDQPSLWKKTFSYLFFFLAMASKEDLLTTLAVIPLMLYFFRNIPVKKIISITIPYTIVFLLFILIRLSVIGTTHANSPITYLDNPLLAAGDINIRAGTNIYIMGMYFLSLLFPYKLACDYSYNSIPLIGIGGPKVILWLLVYAALIFMAVKGFKKKNIFSFCILYFLITISIYSSILIVSSNAYADRFLYTASLSVCIALGFLLYKITNLGSANKPASSSLLRLRKLPAYALLILLIGLCSFQTVRYIPEWKDDLTLFAYNVKMNPDNARMHKNLGGEYVRQAMQITSDSATKKELASRGIKELEKANALYPRDAVGYIHLSNGHIIMGDLGAAKKDLERALQIDPVNRFAFISLGYIYYMRANYQEAANTWERIDSSLRGSGDLYNLYLVYSKLGNTDKAAYYKKLSEK